MIPCTECDGTGIVYDVETRRARPCVCRPTRIAQKRAASLEGRIPKLYRDLSFDRDELLSIKRSNPSTVREVRQYIDTVSQRLKQGEGIWFTGDVGTGKTTLAMMISAAAMRKAHTVAIYSLPRLLEMLRRTYDDNSRYSLNDLIDQLAAVDLLHIDDVGAEQSTPWVLEQLYSIVNARYEDGRAIVVTTNLIKPDGDQALIDQIGERTVSRIYEICGDPKPMFGIDQRRELRYEPSPDLFTSTASGTPNRLRPKWQAS